MMTRTPDEIKQGLEGLKFIANAGRIDDALALIQQLEAENAQLHRCIENMTDKLNAAHDEAAKLQAERDAAVKELEHVAEKVDQSAVYIDNDIYSVVDYNTYLNLRNMVDDFANWQYESEWRGVQKED